MLPRLSHPVTARWGNQSWAILPDVGRFWWAVFAPRLPIGLVQTSSELRSSEALPTPSSVLTSPFLGVRPASQSEGSPCLLLLLPPLSFTGISPNKSPLHLIPSSRRTWMDSAHNHHKSWSTVVHFCIASGIAQAKHVSLDTIKSPQSNKSYHSFISFHVPDTTLNSFCK